MRFQSSDADAASLYCYSLLAPATAQSVRLVFVDILDSFNGQRALIHAARLLRRAGQGDHPDLADTLRMHAEDLIAVAV